MAASGGHKLERRGNQDVPADAPGGAPPVRGIEGAIKVFGARAGLLNRGQWFTRSPPREPQARSASERRNEAFPSFGDSDNGWGSGWGGFQTAGEAAWSAYRGIR